MKKILESHLLWWICWLVVWVVLAWLMVSFRDPDFGWQWRTGEWIWQHGQIPKTDLFSYTMPDYPWHYPAWLAEVMFYWIYIRLGYTGLAIGLAGLVSIGWVLQIPKMKMKYYLLPLALVMAAGGWLISVRAKMLSLLLAGVLFWILRKAEDKPQWLWGLPGLFCLWSNLHGGVAIGLVILGWWIITELSVFSFQFSDLRKEQTRFKKQERDIWMKRIIGVGLGSGLASLINPFGWRVYEEVYQTLTSRQLQGQVNEWLPINVHNPALIVYVLGLGILAVKWRKKLSWFEVSTSAGLLVGSLFSRRLLVYFLLFSLAIYGRLLERAVEWLKSRKEYQFIWLWRSGLVIGGCLWAGWLIWHTQKDLTQVSETNYYPMKAVEYLKQHLPEGEMFSVYNWGGYLIDKLPEKQVFVDGRMAIWEKDGYSAFR